MLTLDEKKKQGLLDEFATVTALYQTLNEGREHLRTKRAEYRNDEVQALPIDFLLDVEIKAKRALPSPLYAMFMRLASSCNIEVPPEAAKLLLGLTWKEYGLGVDGSYRRLYYTVKNDQIRSFLKGKNEDTQNNVWSAQN